MLVNQFGEFALAFNEFVHLVVAHRFGELHVHLLVLFEDVHHLLHALAHHLLHGEGVVELRFLRQVAYAVAGRENHLALEGLVESGDDFQQGGLTGAVQTQHADFRSIEKGEVDVFKNLFLRGNRLADVHH